MFDGRTINRFVQLALKPIIDRLDRLDNKAGASGGDTKADSSVFAILWADRPTNPRPGETRFFRDKTFPGAPNSGVLAVWDVDNSIWNAQGQDVAGM